MMDINKVILKFKINAKGTHTIAYCDEYPAIQGVGETEDQATANFWKSYNTAESKQEHAATMSKKMQKEVAEKDTKKKKAA